MSNTRTVSPGNLAQFRALINTVRPLAQAVIEARAFAQAERERVDSYVQPIFEGYRFEYDPAWTARDASLAGPIKSVDELYLTDLDDPLYKAFNEDVLDAHAAHGWQGERGKCPALVAEGLAVAAERALITATAPAFGVSPDDIHTFDKIGRQWLETVIRAALDADLEAKALSARRQW